MTPDSHPNPWSDLVRRARTDRPPAVDLPALLRAARAEAALPLPVSKPGFLEEFTLLFATPRALCAAAAAAALMAYFGYSDWQQLSGWADVAAMTLGVVS